MLDIYGRPLSSAPPSGNFSRGVKQGIQELKGTAYGLAGLAGGAAGIPSLHDWGLENAQEAFNKSEDLAQPTDSLEGIESIGDAGAWASHSLGNLIPQVVPMILGGGLGTMVAKKAIGAGVRVAAEAAAKKAAEGIALDATDVAMLKHVAQVSQIGATAGAGTVNYGQIAGTSYPSMAEEGHDEPGRVLAGSIPAAAVGLFPEFNIAKNIFSAGTLDALAKKGLIAGATTEGLKQAALQGVASAGQIAVQRAVEYKPTTGDEAMSAYMNAAAAGALGGGVLGAAAGTLSRHRDGSFLPSANPLPGEQLNLDLRGGEMLGPKNVTTADLDVGPVFEPQQYNGQASLNLEPFKYSPEVQGKRDTSFITPEDIATKLGGKPETQPLEIPSNETKSIELPAKPGVQTAYSIAAEKASRGELLTPYERYLVNNPPEAKVETAQTSARTPEPQQTSFLEQQLKSTKELTNSNPTPLTEPAKGGAVPGQGELFDTQNNPTYAATQGAAPDYAVAAEQAAKLYGYKLTDKRQPLAMQAEQAFAEKRIPEDTRDQVHELLRQSKLAQAERVLDKETKNAPQQIEEQESVSGQHQDRDSGRSPTEASNSDSLRDAARQQKETEAISKIEARETTPLEPEEQVQESKPEKQNAAARARELISTIESTKDEKEYNQSLYDLYKQWYGGNPIADKYFGEKGNVSKSDMIKLEERFKNDRLAKAQAQAEAKNNEGEGDEVAKLAEGKALTKIKLDAVLYDALQSPRETPDELLDLIGASHPDRFTRAYARFLKPLVKGIEVRTRTTAEDMPLLQKFFGADAERVAARFSGATDTVTMYDTKNTASLLMHELTHAATMKALATDGEGSKEMHSLYQMVKDKGVAADYYAMTNVREFVAEAFSNPRFQDELKSITLPTRSPWRNAWEAFKSFVAKLLGVNFKFRSAFNDVMDASEKLFKEEATVRESNVGTLAGTVPTSAAMMNTPKGKAQQTMAALGNNPKWIDTVGVLRRGKMYVQFLRDLKDNYGALLKDEKGGSYLGQYVDKAFAMAASANDIMQLGGTIAERWDGLRALKPALNELAASATEHGIHPDIPLDREQHGGISNAHLIHEDGTVPEYVQKLYDKLHKQYEDLGEKGQQVYKDARDFNANNWNKREALINRKVNEVYEPLIKEAQAVGNTDKVKELMKERADFIAENGQALSRVPGPYFSLKRFGDYYVVYKSDKYKAAEAAHTEASKKLNEVHLKHAISDETAKQAIALNPEIMKQAQEAKRVEVKAAKENLKTTKDVLDKLAANGEHYANEAFESEGKATLRARELGTDVMKKQDYYKQLSPVTRGFLDKLADAVAGSLPESQALSAKEALTQLWIKMLPDTSAMKAQLRRRNVAGYDSDMLRAFSRNTQSEAHYMSRLEHMDDLTSALYGMQRSSKEEGTPLQAKELYAEVARRHVESMQFTNNPISQALTASSFVWQLGISPAFLGMQMMQPWMVSMPVMGARHGFLHSSQELGKAALETAREITMAIKESGNMFFEVDPTKFGSSAEERKRVGDMLHYMQRDGLLDFTVEGDVGALAKGNQSKLSKFNRYASVIPHQVEVASRIMTAVAAFRMEYAKTGSIEGATAYTRNLMDKTHVDYSSTNAPSFLKPGFMGGFGPTLFQYRKYQLGMLSLFANKFAQATRGDPEAAKALLGLYAMHAAVAGALGTPLAGTALFMANMVNKAFGNQDKPWDAEIAFRNWLADSLGVDAGGIAAKGLPMLAGVDFSNRLGLSNIGSPIQVLHTEKKGRDFWLEVLAASAGPTLGGLMPQMADGVKMMGDGDMLKGSEKLLPKTLADPVKAYRTSTEGVTTSKGVIAIAPERVDSWDTFMQAMGVNPKEFTERGSAVGAVADVRQALNDRKQAIEKAYVEGRVSGDQEATAHAQEEMQAYNDARREAGEPTMKAGDLIQAYRKHMQEQKNMTEQGVGVSKKERGLEQIARFASVD